LHERVEQGIAGIPAAHLPGKDVRRNRNEDAGRTKGAIIPLILGDEAKTVGAAAHLRAKNVFVPAIRFPAVARGAARLRITLTAAHSANDVAELVRALGPVINPKS
jgi:7-keto-8-aminopelargonate synthetase-like enzyme